MMFRNLRDLVFFLLVLLNLIAALFGVFHGTFPAPYRERPTPISEYCAPFGRWGYVVPSYKLTCMAFAWMSGKDQL